MPIIEKLSKSDLKRELELLTECPAKPIENSDKNADQKHNDTTKEDSQKHTRTQAPSDYAGDAEDNTPSPTGNFQRLEFLSSVALISFFDQNINKGIVRLHDWQVAVGKEICESKADSKNPFKFALCACNGSGKDAFVIAPFAIWFCCSKIKSRCIITSSSGVQLSSQTENYIRELAIKLNEYFTSQFGGPIFKINQRFIKCILSGSEIRLFATDEEGKAEGYHPIEPNAEFCIIVNEAKSVAPEIFRALRRCTGYNYWIDVSSPGQPFGDFYNHYTNWTHKLLVDYKLCPHHSDSEREEDKLNHGEHSAYYRSKWLALFTSIEGNSVLPIELIDRVRTMSKEGLIEHTHKDWPLRVGIDLAAGGDENCICGVKGNKITHRLNFREKDTTVAASRIDMYLRDTLGLAKDHEHIYIDDGGVGRGITDMLANMGWNLARIRNQSRASNTKMYLNQGAENWNGVRQLLDNGLLLLDIDDKLFYEQLSNRYYRQEGSQGKIALESKAQAKANGRPSPDRADAYVLALKGLLPSDFDKKDTKDVKAERKSILVNRSVEALEAHNEKERYDTYERKQQLPGKPIFGSIRRLLCQR